MTPDGAAPSSGSRRPGSPPSGWRHLSYLLGFVAVVTALAFLFWPRSDVAPKERGVIFKVPGRKAIPLTRARVEGIASGDLSLPMPGRRSVNKGSARITYKFDRDGAQRQLAQLARSGGSVHVQERPVEVMIETPIVKQVRAVDLSGSPPAAIFERLLSGHAVLAWVGLSAGPYASWTGPRGEAVRGHFGEHAVLLVGLAGSRVLLNDPLTGEAQNWSRQEFKKRWSLLGRRAISA